MPLTIPVQAADQLATLFNNEGVDIHDNDTESAWFLFKGALEIILATERCTEAIVRVDCFFIEKAVQIHEQRQAACCSTTTTKRVEEFVPTTGDAEQSSMMTDEPQLYAKPLVVSETMATSVLSASIIFNLALVEHMENRTSERIPTLYRLSSKLLVDEDRHDSSNFVRMVLTNNMAVYYHENNEKEKARTLGFRIYHSFMNSHFLNQSRVNKDLQSILDNAILMIMPRTIITSQAA